VKNKIADPKSYVEKAYELFRHEEVGTDTTRKHIVDVLSALTILIHPKTENERKALSELASVARSFLRTSREATLFCRDEYAKPAVLDRIEEWIGSYPSENVPQLVWQIHAELGYSSWFGRPQPDSDILMSEALLDDNCQDKEERTKAVLVAYGLTPKQARNAFSYRDKREFRKK